MIGGINARARMVLDALSDVMVQTAGCPLVILGDVFDTTRPDPPLLTATGRVLKSGALGVPVYILMGNHDQQSSALGDHALGPLGLIDNVMVFETPQIVRLGKSELWMVPFEPGRASEWLPVRLQELAALSPWRTQHAADPPERVLALHLGIHDRFIREQIFWAGKASDAVSVEQLSDLCRVHRITATFAGNWHGFQQWEFFWPKENFGTTIVQVGALVPTGWDNSGWDGYGGVSTFETAENHLRAKVTRTEVRGPRFLKVTSQAELDQVVKTAKAKTRAAYVQWVCGPDEVRGVQATLKQCVEDNLIAGYAARVSKASVSLAAKEAAQVVRSSSTLHEALTGFVSKRELPPDVDRDELLDRTREYLAP